MCSSCRDHDGALVRSGVPLVMQEPYAFREWDASFAPLRSECMVPLQLTSYERLSLDECKRKCIAAKECGSITYRSKTLACKLNRRGALGLASCRQGRCQKCIGRKICNLPCAFVRTG